MKNISHSSWYPRVRYRLLVELVVYSPDLWFVVLESGNFNGICHKRQFQVIEAD